MEKKTPYEDHTTKKKNMPLTYLMHFQFVTSSEEADRYRGKKAGSLLDPIQKNLCLFCNRHEFFCKAA